MINKIPEHDKPVIVWAEYGYHPEIIKCWHIQETWGVWYLWVTCESSWEEYLKDYDSYSINTITYNISNWSYVPEKQYTF
jgi:hypothetical protein